MENDVVIRVDTASKQFGDLWAVQDLSFDIPKGQIFCLLGPSGSGKTTVIRMLLGVYSPDAGSLAVFDRPPTEYGRTLYKRIGYMPQHFVLYPTLTIEENLNFMGQLYGMGLRRRRRRIHEMLEFLELEEHGGKTTNELSGGMQRRVALAAAFLHEPELVFLDEPTAGIDPILRAKFWEEFRRLNEAGTTLVVTTQYVSEATNADQVAILSEGTLVAMDSPEGLRRRALGGTLIEVDARGITERVINVLQDHPLVQEIEDASYNYIRVIVADSDDIPSVVNALEEEGVKVENVTEIDLPFDDVFVRLVEDYRQSAEQEDAHRVPVGGPTT